MKLYREGKCQIRIHLTKEDLDEMEITPEEMDYDSKKGRKIFRELFEIAKKETGFDARGEKIYIQLYPMEKGGCDLFVTKLEEEDAVDCFRFSSFDSFYRALDLSKTCPSDIKIYQSRAKEHFYTILSSQNVPNIFYEFGEKITLPSETYLKIRCRKVSWNKRKHWNGKSKRTSSVRPLQ